MFRSWFCLIQVNQFFTGIEKEKNFLFLFSPFLFLSSCLFNKGAELGHADNKGLYLLEYPLEKVNSPTSLCNAFLMNFLIQKMKNAIVVDSCQEEKKWRWKTVSWKVFVLFSKGKIADNSKSGITIFLIIIISDKRIKVLVL